MKFTRWLVLLALALALGLFFALDLGRHFSLDAVKSARADWVALYAAKPLTVVAAYVLLYIALFALALPVNSVLMLAGGALFGFWIGTVVVSFASALGATLAFLVSRYLFADFARARLGARVAWLDEGIAREGSFYLFSLRLVPLLPPAAINVLFGLTKIRVRTFYWVSQVGMLAITVLHVAAGTQLAKLESPRDILSPGLLVTLVLIGLLPLAGKKLVQTLRARRAAAR